MKKGEKWATFEYLLKTYDFFTPDFSKETRFTRSSFHEYTDLLGKPVKSFLEERREWMHDGHILVVIKIWHFLLE
ncbi:hypothetical protein PTKIN_Ptkin17bG0064300 [Pterospermum kingtungense]